MSTAVMNEPPAADRVGSAPGSARRLFERARAAAARPGVLAIVDQGLVSATSFLTGFGLVRACSPEDMGVYTLAMTLVIVAMGVQTELVTNPFNVFSQRRRGGTLDRYAGSAAVHQLVVASLTLLGMVGLLWLFGRADALGRIWPTLLVAGPLVMTREFVRQMSFARFRFLTALKVDAATSGLQLATLATLWWTDTLSAETALASLGLACAVAGGFWWLGSQHRLQPRRRLVWKHARRNWRFSRWTLATYLVGSTTPFVMPWVVEFFHEETAVGLLASCNALIGLSYTFTTGVANWLTAGAARAFQEDGRQGLVRVLRRTAVVLLAVLGPFVAATWFAGDWMLTLVYGPSLAGLGRVSFVIACGVLATAANVLVGNGLWAIERPQDGFLADIVVCVSTAALALMWVPEGGIFWAAMATAVGVSLGAVVRTATLLRHLRGSA